MFSFALMKFVEKAGQRSKHGLDRFFPRQSAIVEVERLELNLGHEPAAVDLLHMAEELEKRAALAPGSEMYFVHRAIARVLRRHVRRMEHQGWCN